MLAWTEEPSLLTIMPWTTFKMAGMAPQFTVQKRYPAVASQVISSAPSRFISGVRKAMDSTVKSSPLNTEP